MWSRLLYASTDWFMNLITIERKSEEMKQEREEEHVEELLEQIDKETKHICTESTAKLNKDIVNNFHRRRKRCFKQLQEGEGERRLIFYFILM